MLGDAGPEDRGYGQLAELWLRNRARHTERAAASLASVLRSSRRSFQKSCESFFQDAKKDDIEFLVEGFLSWLDEGRKRGAPLLWRLYSAVLHSKRIEIALGAGRPVVDGAPGVMERWASLIDFFDPDNFVAMRIAETSTAARDMVFRYDRWPLVVGPADRDLRRLCEGGLSDLHMHFKSLWPVSLSWQRVLRHRSRAFRDGLAPERLSAYRAKTSGGRGSQRLDAEIGKELELIEEACGSVWGDHGLGRFRTGDIAFFSPLDHRPQRPRDVLAAERRMLASAWIAILHGEEEAEMLEVALDRYLLAKCLFRDRHLQGLETTHRGLYAFDATRKHNSHLGRFAREETGRGGFSEARYRVNNGLLFEALRECSTLCRAEVRIAPPEAPPIRMAASYGRGLRAFGRLVFARVTERSWDREDVGASGNRGDDLRGLHVRTAIHFKRALAGTGADEPLATLPLLRKLVEFDVQTAALQDLRHRIFREGWRAEGRGRGQMGGGAARGMESESQAERRVLTESMALLGRVDLAGPERGAGPWLVAPYVQLLRGERDACELLSRQGDNPYLERWSTLHRQGRMLLGLSAPALGLTCHAGEDYYTLVDGLWHIDNALEGWKLHAGDGLGHALALAIDPLSRLGVEDLERVTVPVGVELDSMIWLHAFLVRGGLIESRLRAELESWIADMARFCYGEYIGLRELWQKIDRAHLPLPANDRRLAVGRLPRELPDRLARGMEPGDLLRLADLFDVRVAGRRARRKAPSSVQKELGEALARVQKAVLEKITSRGVVIETNPSSNLRMLRLSRASELPVLRLAGRLAEDVRVTICTDNPGVYDTDIETEYGIAFSGLLDLLGHSSREPALRLLRHIRDVGLRDAN